jgi:hypothetical protein
LKEIGGTIKIHHQRCVEQIVTKYGLKGSSCCFGKPLPQGFVIAQSEPCEVSHQTYQSLIGRLMYLAHWKTRYYLCLSQSLRSDGEWSMAGSSTRDSYLNTTRERGSIDGKQKSQLSRNRIYGLQMPTLRMMSSLEEVELTMSFSVWLSLIAAISKVSEDSLWNRLILGIMS